MADVCGKCGRLYLVYTSMVHSYQLIHNSAATAAASVRTLVLNRGIPICSFNEFYLKISSWDSTSTPELFTSKRCHFFGKVVRRPGDEIAWYCQVYYILFNRHYVCLCRHLVSIPKAMSVWQPSSDSRSLLLLFISSIRGGLFYNSLHSKNRFFFAYLSLAKCEMDMFWLENYIYTRENSLAISSKWFSKSY